MIVSFAIHDLSEKELDSLTFFARTYRFLHDPSSSFGARFWSVLMVLAIITSSVMILLQSMPSLKFIDAIANVTTYVEFYSVALFSFDYLLKLFSVHSYADCVLPKPLPYNVLWQFFVQPLNLLDFISVVPFWVQYVLGDGATSGNAISLVFRIVRMMRIIRLLKVAQYSRSIDVFFRVLVQACDALLLLLFFVGFGCIVFGTFVYICEAGTLALDPSNNITYGQYLRPNVLGNGYEVSPFSSIPLAFWFVITTLTTVGYGDMVPTSTMGRVVGGATMLSGVLFISTPLVIFGTHFQNEFTKELERVAFVRRRQEKIKLKQEEKEKKARAKEREERERRIQENPNFGIAEDDPMAAAMGLGGGENTLPGQTAMEPTSPKNEDAIGSFSSGPNMSGGPPRRSGARASIMMRTGSMGNLGLGPRGTMGGGPGAPVVGPNPNAMMLQNMSTVGGNGCTCPCVCGARNLAGTIMPGENIIGGVRKNVMQKTAAGVKPTGPAILNNPTAADQLSMKKGVELANAVLPDRAMAERGAAMMAAGAPTTIISNMSAAHIIEMQTQLEGLKTVVSQLGGLLVAGGASASVIAKAMIDPLSGGGAPATIKDVERAARKSMRAMSKVSTVNPLAAGIAANSSSPAASTGAGMSNTPPGGGEQPANGKLLPRSSSQSNLQSTSPAAPPSPSMNGLTLPPAAVASDSTILASPAAVSVEVKQSGPPPLSVDQIIPAHPRHTFPPAVAEEGVIECTMRMVESMIQQPQLTPKLLSKPPFRFLHDIVTSFIRTHKFPEGYFDEHELNAGNLTEIAPKLEFLEKLLDLLSTVNQSDLSSINPKKIVAGLEHENTNKMLQELAKAAASGISVTQITDMLEAQEAAGALTQEGSVSVPGAGLQEVEQRQTTPPGAAPGEPEITNEAVAAAAFVPPISSRAAPISSRSNAAAAISSRSNVGGQASARLSDAPISSRSAVLVVANMNESTPVFQPSVEFSPPGAVNRDSSMSDLSLPPPSEVELSAAQSEPPMVFEPLEPEKPL